jgi:arsenite-transporting ATPase
MPITLPGARFLLFTGKGGVGKTSLACAAALQLADRGERVLVVSTDPASNLDEMLGVRLVSAPTPVPGAPGLWGANLDPGRAADTYRTRALATLADAPVEVRDRRREELSGACTTEVAVFDAFSALLTDGAPDFDRVVLDTAPTGHTLRLLALPAAWTSFLDDHPDGVSCLGPHQALGLEEDRFRAAMETLQDPARTAVILVVRPEPSALAEADRTATELRALSLTPQRLLVNGAFQPAMPGDPVADALAARGDRALAALPPGLAALPRDLIPLRVFDTVGLANLRALLTAPEPPGAPLPLGPATDLPSLRRLVDELEAAGPGLVLVMGKGGVGKTTIAAALAVALADRGHPVVSSTTDPAAHLAATFDGRVAGLEVERIDPRAETETYVAKVLARKGAGLDDDARALLLEDLRSPCTEEVAVFHAFSRLVFRARRGFVVLDTAPTGHTLLLLDATGAYHQQVIRDAPGAHLSTPLTELRNPARTHVVLVTLAETTPVSEAAQLQDDLRRAGIEPWAWVIDSSLAATTTADPVLRARIIREHTQLERVRSGLARRVAVVPWCTEPPVGPERLRALTR